MRYAVIDKDGKFVNKGDIVVSFRGDKAKLINATRLTEQGKSGKVVVEWLESKQQYEYFASVFNLTVVL